MQFVTLKPAELDAFVLHHPLGNFVQSAPNAERIAYTGWKSHYVGIKTDKGAIVATAVLYEWQTLGQRQFECIQGPVVDYHNPALITTLLTELKKYVKKRGGLSLRIQPPLLLRQGTDPSALQDNKNNLAALGQLLDAGFRAVPPAITDANARYVRWFFAKDMTAVHDEDALLHSFDTKTRSCINGSRKYGVTVRQITSEQDLKPFAKLLIRTGERRGFSGRDEMFYTQLFRAFPRQQAWFLLAELNLADYQSRLSAQQQRLRTELSAAANDPAQQGYAKEIDNQLTAVGRRLADYQQMAHDADNRATVPLAAAVFIHQGDEVVYFLSGSDERYGGFYGSYALQYTALSRAMHIGVSRYNFYGTSGKFNGFADQEGVYKFKKGFGGQLEEYAGCYDYIARPMRYSALQFMRAVRNRIS